MAKQNGTPKKLPANGVAPNEEELRLLPAYFLSLSLENVRCFGPKAKLDLSDGNGKPARWTIILGLNGTGKTTVLQSLVAFEAVSNSMHGPRLRFMNRLFEVKAYLRSESNQSTFSAELCYSTSIDESPQYVKNCQCLLVPVVFEQRPQPHGKVAMGDPGTSLWCCGYGATRRASSAVLTGAEFNDATATLFSERAELRNPEEWLLQLDYAAKSKNKDAEHRLTQVKELLLRIMPEDEITDIRFTTTGGVNPKARAEFQTPYGWVPLRQLGYGYQTLITWVADLVSRMVERYPESKNPLAEPAVVLVDEIDLHLHPKWQRKLMGFLTERFPNTQFIATAHSPLVVQAAADANLAVLRREGDHVVIDNEVDNIRNWRIDQILTSDLFGLETARPPHVEAWLREQKALLGKSKLNATEKKRLGELDTLIGNLQMGESTKEIQDREKMLNLLESLQKERKPAS